MKSILDGQLVNCHQSINFIFSHKLPIVVAKLETNKFNMA